MEGPINQKDTPIQKARYVIIIIIMLFVCYLLYKAYQYSNVSERVKEMIPYEKDLKWVKAPNCEYDSKYHDTILADMFICSSSNTPFVANLKYDYLDLEVIKKTLMAGARYIEFTIVENDLSSHPTPVVSKEFKDDQMSTTFNYLELADVCYTVKKYGFQPYFDEDNQESDNVYPLFIYLNVQSKNIDFLNDVATTIKNIWGDRLLDKTYGHMFNDLAHVSLCKLFNKIVILTDKGDQYQSSQLDVLINYSKLVRLHYNEIQSYNLIERARREGKTNLTREEIIEDPNKIDLTRLDISMNDMGKYIIESEDYLTEYTKQNLVVVYPNTKEDVEMKNHDYLLAFAHGCNFVSMNFQVYDEHFKNYIKIFEEGPLKLKSLNLRLPRKEIQEIKPPEEVPSPLLAKIMSGVEYNFRGIGIAIIPFFQSGIYMKHSPTTRRMIISNMPPATPKDRYNKLGFNEEDIFSIEAGLSKIKNSVSYKSVRYPNRYLQIVGDVIQLLPNDNSKRFKENASFMMIDAGQEDEVFYYRIISAIDKEKYVRVMEDQLYLDKYNGEQNFDDETKFSFGVAKINKYRSFRANNGKYLRILDGGFLTANIPSIDTSTKFKVYKLDDEHYSILASNGNLLEYDGKDTVAATSGLPNGNFTKFRLIKEGNLYKITTFFSSHMKTLHVTNKDAIKVSYDGNILGPGNTAPKLPATKFFALVETYGIEREAKK